MAIKAAQILHDAYGFIIDRIQTGGVDNVSIPEERTYELGNFQSVSTVRDTPDLTFSVESTDVSAEFEALVTFADPSTIDPGDEFDLSDAKPLDIVSPFKAGQGIFTTHGGVIIPYLTLEQSTYRGGIRQNFTQQHQFRGDSYFFVDEGAPYYEEFDGDGSTDTFNLAHTAKEYNYSGDTVHVVGACVVHADGTSDRLFFGDDPSFGYTDTDSDFTLNDPTTAEVGSTIKVVYGSADVATYPQTVHENASVKPAAVRHQNVDVYIGTSAATPTFSRWSSVQSIEANRRVNLDRDEEFGNPQYVAQDYDVPEVNGNIVVRPRNNDDLWEKVFQVANVPSGEVAGPLTSVPLPMEIRISDPDDGVRLKTLYVPDARFTIPGVQGRVQQKTEVTFSWSSDSGQLLIYSGNRYGT